MRGRIVSRYPNSFNVVVDCYPVDPATGITRRKQVWHTVKGTRKDAERKLAELLGQAYSGTLIEPAKITVGGWLDGWLETAIKPPNRRLRTYETYKSVVEAHLKPRFGSLRLQALTPLHVQAYFTDMAAQLAPATLEQHYMVLSAAVKAAVRQGYMATNVVGLILNKPHATDDPEDVLENVWEAEEARKFLEAARQFGPQAAAFYALALDSGARKGELCGLKWEDLDLERGEVRIVRTLVKPGPKPVFGPVKNALPRTIPLNKETVALLRRHRANQAEIKLRNGEHYHDHGLVFAKEWEDRTWRGDFLGDPLQLNNLGQRQYAKIVKAAGVRRIKFHGLRHTCATLLLKAGVPVKVVQERLGHRKIETTLNVYAHVLPSMSADATAKLEAILYAR